MFAITFDMDTTALQASDHNGRSLRKHGFDRQQGSVYFGDETAEAVRCVLAVQDLANSYAWFSPSVRDIRMLRVEDNNDLTPAITALQP